MKIAVITLMDDSNLGNRLQNYAIQQLFKKKGHSVTSLYSSFRYNSPFSKNGINSTIHDILLKTGIRSSHIYTTYFKKDKKMIRGLDFTKKYINTSKKYIYKFKHHKMARYKNDFDMWCVGSDQVWNGITEQNYAELFLMFAEKSNTFSISASFGNTTIGNQCVENYVKGLNHIGNISVREYDGQQLVYNLTNRESTLLLDPTMILTPKEWLEIARKPQKHIQRKYILTYFLGGMSEIQLEYIEKYATERDLEIIDVENWEYGIGPSEFVYLINGAEFVFTDSFHGCAFSTTFKKSFMVFNRNNYGFDMSSRVTTLLNTFKLENNYMSEINCNYLSFKSEIDRIRQQNLSCIDTVIAEQRQIFDNYLCKVLEK